MEHDVADQRSSWNLVIKFYKVEQVRLEGTISTLGHRNEQRARALTLIFIGCKICKPLEQTDRSSYTPKSHFQAAVSTIQSV